MKVKKNIYEVPVFGRNQMPTEAAEENVVEIEGVTCHSRRD
jgi:hypothetical protein